MIEVKEQYPFTDDEGNIRYDLIRHYAVDEDNNKFYILQVETGIKYIEAVDAYPCKYTYEATDEPEEVEMPDEPTENLVENNEIEE